MIFCLHVFTFSVFLTCFLTFFHFFRFSTLLTFVYYVSHVLTFFTLDTCFTFLILHFLNIYI